MRATLVALVINPSLGIVKLVGGIAGGNALLKEWLYWYHRRIGMRTGSTAIVAIFWSGGFLLVHSTNQLLDPQADREVVDSVRHVAQQVAGVRAVEKLWVRKTGIEYLVDIHIQVDPQMTVEQGHRIGHQVKHDLLLRFVRIKDVLVHLEPYSGQR